MIILRPVPIAIPQSIMFLSLIDWVSGSATAQVGDPAGPEASFNNACRTSHSWKEGDNRLGPNLYRVVGRKAGTTEGYAPSAAMQASGVTWDEATLDKFITNPDSVVTGNNMKPYTGISDAGVRKSIIEFLKTVK